MTSRRLASRLALRIGGMALAAILTTTPTRLLAHGEVTIREFVSTVLEGHTGIILLIDTDSGAILDANKAAEAFYGYPLAVLRTMRIQDINRLGAEEVAAERAKATAEKRNYFIFPHKLANGEIRTVEVYSSPVRGEDGRPLLLSIIHDISGKAVAEEELSAYRLHLEYLVEERTGQVLKAEQQLRSWLIGGLAAQALLIVLLALAIIQRHATVVKLRAEMALRKRAEVKLGKATTDLQRFAEISAHHLREPTRHLIIFTQKLRKSLGRPADDDTEESLSTIETGAAYLDALVRDVQIYLSSDMPLGEGGGDDPVKVARKVVAALDEALKTCGGEVLIGPLPPLPVDAMRLKHLFSTLLDNAIRYSHPDRKLLVRVEGMAEGGATTLTVTDNGIGIPAEYREQVLEVFEHLGNRREHGGTGLGLAVARRIVESCDGTIRLDEAAGGGTAVIIEFGKG